MKTLFCTFFCLAGAALGVLADSTINAVHRFAYGANIGWINWLADGANGAIIGEFVCSGSIYSANCGWIHVGDGTPTDGIQYRNAAIDDYGVNLDVAGNLRGYGYGANIGWVNFEARGAPKVDLLTGKLSGFAYGANVGWISLSNAAAWVQTDEIVPGADSDRDGIADAWERKHTTPASLNTFTATSDRDGDGSSDLQEYRAGTDPLNAAELLRITSIRVEANHSMVTLIWQSQPALFYEIQARPELEASDWMTVWSGPPDPGSTTTRTVPGGSASIRYFRIQAVKPLSR